ncbi:hypothetical protein Skr01_35710 [Sphaerisporangium krabiense]|uniref:Uncharacterized protein n=1 Tax=Sphaerisporangium krabiense TaxID=763782 RepID=A0A7W8Z350_9ACTN|nr:hypothetical protein [Sphaerisporangium krabiense]MBB5626566.1 hypothetical protein [Sphaerisporangium krabiense]GII63486.1 hypothetical protein Skr01_35710 [Sphaerisporangium krabiense]
MSGYSYTTISMHPGETARVGVSIYPDERASVRYYPAGDDPHAFIGIDYGDAQINIGTTQATKVTDAHVTFARALFDAAARFLTDCERWRDQHARQVIDETAHDDTAAPGKAA